MPTPIRCDPSLFQKDLTGKIIIITGCTSGTGLCCATQLVKQKATVIMASRNVQEGQKTAEEAGGIFMELDLASLQSVRDFCKAFLAKYNRLDILVNNAGVMIPPLTRTKEGYELQMGTNHFGHFLLTELLKDVLEKSSSPDAPSRVVILSSCASALCDPEFGKKCEIDYSDLHWTSREYDKGEAYAQSKLANVLHAMEIPKRYKNVSAYSLHPGWVQSNLMRHLGLGPIQTCFDCCCVNCTGMMINVWDGSQTSLHCILEDTNKLKNGEFYSQFGIYKDEASKKGGWPMPNPNPQANAQNAARLWDESVKIVSGGKDGAAIVINPPEQQPLLG